MAQQKKQRKTGAPMTEQERQAMLRRREERLAAERQKKPGAAAGTNGRQAPPKGTPHNTRRGVPAQQNKQNAKAGTYRDARSPQKQTARTGAPGGQKAPGCRQSQPGQRAGANKPPQANAAQKKAQLKQQKKLEKQQIKLQKQRERQQKKAQRQEEKRRLKAQKLANQPRPGSHTAARRARRKRALIALAALLVFIVVGAVLSVTVLFKIDSYRVEGDCIYTQQQLVEAFGHQEGENMFRFNLEESAKQMQNKLPYLETIKVRRRLPGTVVFMVTPATEYATLQQADGSVLVLSETLRVLASTDTAPEGLIEITGYNAQDPVLGSVLEGQDQLQTGLLTTLVEAVQACGIENITKLDVSDEYEISAVWNGRITIKLGTSSQLEYKLSVVDKALEVGTQDGTFTESSGGVIDASTAGKAYYQP
ncbi:MAG: FtsQ-type POTRA domain-containing protein [Pygmaiobacter massiliensis]|nr:FtsQ-type POTRA domain-containing protein [Pygmaiobacter massiliensis]